MSYDEQLARWQRENHCDTCRFGDLEAFERGEPCCLKMRREFDAQGMCLSHEDSPDKRG